MEYETKSTDTKDRWKMIVPAAVAVALLLCLRSFCVGWLLPDGSFLETLAQQVQCGNEPIAYTVFSEVQEWINHGEN